MCVCVCVFLWPLVNHSVSTSAGLISITYHTRPPLSFFLSFLSLLPFFLSSSPALLLLSHLNPCRTTIYHLPPPPVSPPPPPLTSSPQYGITIVRLVLFSGEPLDKLPANLGNHEERVTPWHPRLCLHLSYHHHHRRPGPVGIVDWTTHCDTENICRHYRRLVG